MPQSANAAHEIQLDEAAVLLSLWLEDEREFPEEISEHTEAPSLESRVAAFEAEMNAKFDRIMAQMQADHQAMMADIKQIQQQISERQAAQEEMFRKRPIQFMPNHPTLYIFVTFENDEGVRVHPTQLPTKIEIAA